MKVSWLVLVAVLVGGAALYWQSPRPLRADDEFLIEPKQGDQLGAWMNPSGGAGEWVLEGGNVLQNHAVFRYQNPRSGERVTIELHHRDAVPSAALTTEQFALVGVAPAELLGALGSRLRGGEGAYRWIEAQHHPTPPWLRRLRQLQIPIAWFLLAQSPLWLILAGRRAFAQLATLPRGARLGIVAAILAAVVVRWAVAPLRLVVLSIGYQLTAQELTLDSLPRYGAAVAVFHHALLRAFQADHLTILRAHSIIGVVMVPLVAALVLAVARRPGAAVAAAFLWGLVPAFIAHDNSEANTVPLLLWTVSGLILWLDAQERGLGGSRPSTPLAGLIETRDGARTAHPERSRGMDFRSMGARPSTPLGLNAGSLPIAANPLGVSADLVGCAAPLGLALIGRPEFPLLVPAAALALSLASPHRSRLSFGAVFPLAVAIALLAIPHLVHVGESAALLDARDSLPMGRSILGANRVSVLDPSRYPLGLVLFAVAALVLPGARRAAALLLGVATLGFALTWIDIDPANILRVQVPGALFYVLAVALGMVSAFEFAQRRLVRPRVFVLGVGLLVVLSVIPCLPAAFARTNEDEEEAFLREAVRALPAGDFQLVRLDYGDVKGSLSGSPVHLYFPDYLFAPRGSVRGMTEWLRDRSHPAAFLYVGTRCFTPEHPFDPGQSPDTVPMREVCRELLEGHVAAAVIERLVESHGDPQRTGFYGTAVGAPLRLGLYRLRTSAPP